MKRKAIPTRYKGYHFRSRLEARWAVWFDAMEIAFRYEPEGFGLGDAGNYLPDFWLPDLSLWAEIKPLRKDTREEQNKCRALVIATGKPVAMLFDEFCPLSCDPPDFEVLGSNRLWVPEGHPNYYANEKDGVHWIDGCCEWAECPVCGRVGFAHCGQHPACSCVCDSGKTVQRFFKFGEGGGRLETYCQTCGYNCTWKEKEPAFPHKTWKTGRSGKILRAYEAARSARFEFGKSGAT